MNIDNIGSPALKKLAARLPIMSDGKPRRFRLYSECFEWTFTQMQRQTLRPHHRSLIDGYVRDLIAQTSLMARALMHWQLSAA